MATKDTGQGAQGLSRRDFLKASAAATAVVGCGLEIAFDADKALAYENDPTNFKITNTTCPYCSASCGQRVVVALTGANAGKIVDTATYPDGVAYKRGGTDNPAWVPMSLDDAMAEIAPLLVSARGPELTTGANAYNSKGVAFFGSSHMNNESNYMYRKIIANFGSSNVEHQARI